MFGSVESLSVHVLECDFQRTVKPHQSTAVCQPSVVAFESDRPYVSGQFVSNCNIWSKIRSSFFMQNLSHACPTSFLNNFISRCSVSRIICRIRMAPRFSRSLRVVAFQTCTRLRMAVICVVAPCSPTTSNTTVVILTAVRT